MRTGALGQYVEASQRYLLVTVKADVLVVADCDYTRR